MNRTLRESGFKERQFRAGGVLINYAGGPRRGPPLVLIPGQTIPWQSYQRVMPALSNRFTIYAVDVRGHGKSSRTPGAYNYKNIGLDFSAFLHDVVSEPAVVSGNSSGGVIAVWLAANRPELVRGVVCEDPPLFSSEWPRIKRSYVYQVLQQCVDMLGDPAKRDLAGFFAGITVPSKAGKEIIRLPRVLSKIVSACIRLYQSGDAGKPVDLPLLPLNARLFVKGLSEYDPGFSAAFLDNSAHEGFDHADALARLTCPVLLIRAHWFEHETLGLVGAMLDEDVEKVKSLVKNLQYVVADCGHMTHVEKPRWFVKEVTRFCLCRTDRKMVTEAL